MSRGAAFDSDIFVASAVGWCFFLRRCPMAPVTNTWDTQIWVQLQWRRSLKTILERHFKGIISSLNPIETLRLRAIINLYKALLSTPAAKSCPEWVNWKCLILTHMKLNWGFRSINGCLGQPGAGRAPSLHREVSTTPAQPCKSQNTQLVPPQRCSVQQCPFQLQGVHAALPFGRDSLSLREGQANTQNTSLVIITVQTGLFAFIFHHIFMFHHRSESGHSLRNSKHCSAHGEILGDYYSWK